jgi:hypothetical protein
MTTEIMENYLLSLKTSNSYLSKFEVAKFNLSLLMKDKSNFANLRSLRFTTDIKNKKG